jgi:hypothetical protein
MSAQFAGIANALAHNLYRERGIEVSFLPTCPVGLEQERTRRAQDANRSAVAMGSIEQNIFIPTLRKKPSLRTTAVAAMFHTSPLCVVSLRGDADLRWHLPIGAHADTVPLLQRIFPDAVVVASPRDAKVADLLEHNFSGLQAYSGVQASTTTEVPALRRRLLLVDSSEAHGSSTTNGTEEEANDGGLVVTVLEGLHGARLGYSQVLFAADECLQGDRLEVVQDFLDATFEGWEMSIHGEDGIADTALAVAEARRMLELDDENSDHWHASAEYEHETIQLCNEAVKRTTVGDVLGVIDPDRWTEATRWLLNDDTVEEQYGLDSKVW